MKLKSQSFLISITHCENHSWQGTIQWLETGRTLHFRSELELLKLMNDVVGQTSDEESTTRDDNTFRNWNNSTPNELARSTYK